jgi:SPP1 gp7 family putative phage head morphogenesis protein
MPFNLVNQQILTHRAIGSARGRRKVPRQIYPKRIEASYYQALLPFNERVRAAFDDLFNELPFILSAAARARADAGESDRVRAIINDVESKVARTVTQRDIEELASRFAGQTTAYQKTQLERQVRAALGVDLFIQDRALATRVEGFAAENASLIKGLSRDTVSAIEKASLRAVQDGKLWTDLRSELTSRFDIADTRARVIARDQIGKLYGQINASRQKNLGIKRFIWRTVNDGRVREEHEERNGETYSYDSPPDGELPGEPIQCRCTAEPVFEDILDSL